jgi:hypothetical protein
MSGSPNEVAYAMFSVWQAGWDDGYTARESRAYVYPCSSATYRAGYAVGPSDARKKLQEIDNSTNTPKLES